ncbi:sugar phosphate isomerase/epimerase [Arthrobacter sp. BHU FT2]|nr:sugar phosphate isomerase/epimerase [Arthrobacter sp. BHU FT2]
MIDVAPPDLVSHAAAAGFNATGIRVYPGGDDTAWPMLGGNTPMMRETLRRLDDTGLTVLDVEVLRLRPDKDPAEALHILDAAAELGATYALVNCNDPDRARLTKRVQELCQEADQRGLKLGIEFMIFSEVTTLEDALGLLKEVDHPALVIVLDALHFQRSGGTPTQLASIPSTILPYAQLCDGPLLPIWPPHDQAIREARTNRLLPGDGEIPLHDILDYLDPTAALSIESPFPASDPRSPAEKARAAYQALANTVELARRYGAPFSQGLQGTSHG